MVILIVISGMLTNLLYNRVGYNLAETKDSFYKWIGESYCMYNAVLRIIRLMIICALNMFFIHRMMVTGAAYEWLNTFNILAYFMGHIQMELLLMFVVVSYRYEE